MSDPKEIREAVSRFEYDSAAPSDGPGSAPEMCRVAILVPLMNMGASPCDIAKATRPRRIE